MKLIISDKVCIKNNTTLVKTLLALAVKCCPNPLKVFEDMQKDGSIVKEEEKYYVSPNFNETVEKILTDSPKAPIELDESLLQLASKMQKIFPACKMKDKYGRETPYYYRSNRSEVAKRLKRFFEIFGEVPEEKLLNATQRYVDSFQGNYSGMRLIKYFILKDDIKEQEDGKHVEQVSDLATFLENEDAGETNSDISDFTMQMI